MCKYKILKCKKCDYYEKVKLERCEYCEESDMCLVQEYNYENIICRKCKTNFCIII